MSTLSLPKRILLIAVLTLLSVFLLLPVFYIFIGAFFFTDGGLIGGFTLDNFSEALSSMPILRQVANSVVVTICQTAGQIITAILAAYAMVFCNLKRANMWMVVFLLSMMIPAETTVLSNYLRVADWHLIDTLPAVFLPYLVQGFTVFLFRQAFRAFPKELREASMLDGAGHARFMIGILLPMSRATIIAATINAAVHAWNGYFWPLLVTNAPENRTIQVGITQLAGSEASRMGVVLAGTVVAILPALVLTLACNKQVRGMSVSGSIK